MLVTRIPELSTHLYCLDTVYKIEAHNLTLCEAIKAFEETIIPGVKYSIAIIHPTIAIAIAHHPL